MFDHESMFILVAILLPLSTRIFFPRTEAIKLQRGFTTLNFFKF